jgi:hypothetical protein
MSVRRVVAPERSRHSGKRNFDFPAKRRREIVLHARLVGAAQTEDFDRWLIAWIWHNPKAKDQIWSVMEAAKPMSGEITEAKAAAIIEEASITRKHLTADNLARFLGVTHQQRQALRITTIGSVDVGKRARKELRKRHDRLAKERKRRASGARAHSEWLSRTKPWEAMNISRRTWERHRNKARDANSSAAIFLSGDDRLASTERKRESERRCRAEEKKEDFRLATATTLAADRYGSLPLELRLAALCLPVPENLARAA